MPTNFVNKFVEATKANPNGTAIIIEEKFYTYFQLYKASIALARKIEKKAPNATYVGVFTDNNFTTYASIIAILITGKAFVPLNSKLPNERLANIARQIELTSVICDVISQKKVADIFNLNPITPDKKNKIDKVLPMPDTSYDSDAYVLFTSGSTGEPKGIPINQGNFSAFLESLIILFPLNQENRVLQCFELSFDVAIACTFLALSTGATLVVPSLNGIIAVNAFKTILDYNVDVVALAPSAVGYMENYKLVPQIPLPSVKVTLFTGEALPFDIILKWQKAAKNCKTIYNAYGPTEVTVWSYFYKLNDNTAQEIIHGLCPIGQPLQGVVSKVSSIENAGGELLLSGRHVFNSYWKNKDRSKEVFTYDEDGQKWYKTGDIVMLNEYNNLVYISRIDNQVKINGYRIELGEIEFTIKTILDTSSCAVVIGKDLKNNNQLVVFVNKNIDEKIMREALSKKLPFYMIPKKYHKLDALPLNMNGKIDRKKLTQMANEN